MVEMYADAAYFGLQVYPPRRLPLSTATMALSLLTFRHLRPSDPPRLGEHWQHISALPLISHVCPTTWTAPVPCNPSKELLEGSEPPAPLESEVRGRVRLFMLELTNRQHPCATRTKLETHAVARDEIFCRHKQEFIISIKVNKASSNGSPRRTTVKTTASASAPNLLCGMPRPRQGLYWQMTAHRLVVCALLRHLSPSPLTFSPSVPFLELLTDLKKGREACLVVVLAYRVVSIGFRAISIMPFALYH